MLDYLYDQDQRVAHFVAQLIPHCDYGFGPNIRAIGVLAEPDENGLRDLIAGMVYHNYEPKAQLIEMSGAALPRKYWLTRETLARIFQYPFHELRCHTVVMRVQSDNEPLLYVLTKYGFRFSALPHLFGPDRDGVYCYLTRKLWSENKFNRRLAHHVEPAPIEEAA